MLRTLLVFLAFLMWAPPVGADARVCLDESAALRSMLSMRHVLPDRSRAERLCSDAEAALRRVAAEPARAVERIRAVQVLADYVSRRTVEVLARLATDPAEGPSLRRAALVALDRAGQRRSSIARETARRALSDRDAHVRDAAVQCLARTPESRVELERALRRERVSFVRASITRALDAGRAGAP